jgi:polyphosphate kinase
MITKKVNKRSVQYGFVSTGNLNEKTATVYADQCLLTADKEIMSDMNRMFNFIENWKEGEQSLKNFTCLIPCPTDLRHELIKLINKEIKNAKANREAAISLKMNSLSDEQLIDKLYEAAKAGVRVSLIIRGIFCMLTENNKFIYPVKAVSIVDEYLEHSRIFIFHNDGNEKVYISSADWMVRNIDHRVEATCPIKDPGIRKVLIDLFNIQLKDNVKARILDNELSNNYVERTTPQRIRSQEEIYNYLQQFNEVKSEVIDEVGSY